eukprot:TRINITY_DN1143_c0_g1_i1.p1 TRINITY_DN1143_c0_g1~~TRINITY_DN1143_c0_g1_i1.p1  ORF type:complete len:817 (-),score=337.06 TRINITY_DN1143_c0_g1_i1:924-3374(-)
MSQSAEEDAQKKELDKALKEKQEKMELRVENLAANSKREVLSNNLDSSLKKNSAFIKKLRGGLTEDQKDSLCKELLSLNLSRYISEVVTAIAEAKLKMNDINAAVKIASMIHQRYQEFSPLLITTLSKLFTSVPSSETEVEKSNRLIKKRIIFRFMGELLIVGILKDPEILMNLLKDLVQFDIHQLSLPNHKDKDSSFQNLALVVSFVRSSGQEIFGLKKESNRPIDQNNSNENKMEFGTILSDQQQREFYNEVERYFRSAANHLLTEHKELKGKERDNHSIMESRGELSESTIAQYDKLRKSFEKLLANTTSLAELLHLEKDLPHLTEDQNVTRVDATITISFGERHGTKDVLTDSPFDDEDTRSFYENIPDLRSLGLPGILFGDSDNKEKEETKTEESTTQQPEDQKDSKDQKEKEKEKDREKEKEKEKEDKESEVPPNSTLEAILFKLPTCVNRDLIDEAAKEFCYINSKLNRKRLVKALFQVPRTQLALLPYYARMVAVLTKCMKDIGPPLVAMLEDEFYWLYKGKDQINIETKIKNIRFLGELVKFKICSPNMILTCFKQCLDDFVHHNIDVTCNLCESCGRYLYKSAETHVRTKNLLEIMMRLKNAQNLPNRLDTMVENAYYQCIPPERQVKKDVVSSLSPLQLYIRKLIYQDLNKNTTKPIMKQLRKINWNAENEDYVLDCLLKLHKGKYNNVHLIASLIAGLANYHEIVTIKVVDRLLEMIRYFLELNDFKMQQRQIIQMKFLGELYNYCVIESQLIFNTLFLLLSYGQANYDSSNESNNNNFSNNPLDPPNEYFRIRSTNNSFQRNF